MLHDSLHCLSLLLCLSSVMCRSLGSALKDKCLTDVNHSIRCLTLSSKQDGNMMMSETMEHFLQLSPPFLSSLCCHQSNSRASGKQAETCTGQIQTYIAFTAQLTSTTHHIHSNDASHNVNMACLNTQYLVLV